MASAGDAVGAGAGTVVQVCAEDCGVVGCSLRRAGAVPWYPPPPATALALAFGHGGGGGGGGVRTGPCPPCARCPPDMLVPPKSCVFHTRKPTEHSNNSNPTSPRGNQAKGSERADKHWRSGDHLKLHENQLSINCGQWVVTERPLRLWCSSVLKGANGGN